MPLLLVMWSFNFGSHQFIFQGLATFEMNFYAIFLPYVLDCFTQAFFIWNSYVAFVLCLDVFVVCLVFGASIFNFILLIAQFGYLHAVRAFCMCVCSSSSNLLLEQMFFALCRSVLMMLSTHMLHTYGNTISHIGNNISQKW